MKQAEASYQTNLQALTNQMETRIKKIEASIATMATQIVDQMYQSFQTTASAFASKADHIILQSDVASIATNWIPFSSCLKKEEWYPLTTCQTPEYHH